MPDNLHLLTSEIVAAYLARNDVDPLGLPDLIRTVHAALAGAHAAVEPQAVAPKKATPAQIRKSITPTALISFEDGKSYKMLRRHLTGRGLTPVDYREKWGLPRDYPVTAPDYAAMRSAMAIRIGLGAKRTESVPPALIVPGNVAAKSRRRKSVA